MKETWKKEKNWQDATKFVINSDGFLGKNTELLQWIRVLRISYISYMICPQVKDQQSPYFHF